MKVAAGMTLLRMICVQPVTFCVCKVLRTSQAPPTPPPLTHTHTLHVYRWGTNGGRDWRGGREPRHSVNFITAHDGFPLADLVAYNEKHNEANGEDNRSVPTACSRTRTDSLIYLILCHFRT